MSERIAVIGSRDFADAKLMAGVLDEYLPTIKLLISGGARGADKMGERWANKHGITTRIFYPDHKAHKHAFHHRNRLIVEAADLVVAFWNGHSTGTAYTMRYAKRLNKLLRVVRT